MIRETLTGAAFMVALFTLVAFMLAL